MANDPKIVSNSCLVCGAHATVFQSGLAGYVVQCPRCGDFEIDRALASDAPLPYTDQIKAALASYVIRQLQGLPVPGSPHLRMRPSVSAELIDSLPNRSLPTPAETNDNLLLWLVGASEGRPGKQVEISFSDLALLGTIGAVTASDASWHTQTLKDKGLLQGEYAGGSFYGNLTAVGWERVEKLRKAVVTSRFAFFARKFDNDDLNKVFETCLAPAVRQTGYELRTVTQRAGLVDAVIEDEIRRCSFVVADLSDDNAGAYWEAGFAEGLGKPVIYLCKSKDGVSEKRTHFDANHRHTVRWDLATLDQTAIQLKAVIRNTLLGAAKQSDE